MKKVIYISVLILAFSCCSNTEDNNHNAANSKSSKNINSSIIDKTIHLTKAEFLTKVYNFEKNKEWKYEGDLPCIIDFYADWCGPCRSLAPVLEELAKQYKGKIIIYKINTDNEKELAQAFGIQSLPTLLFVPKNEKPQMAKGALPKKILIESIENVLLKK